MFGEQTVNRRCLMKAAKMKRKELILHWTPVFDANGDVHLESSWSREKVSPEVTTAA
jgi:hypothetical protein